MSISYKSYEKEDGKFGIKKYDQDGNSAGVLEDSFTSEYEANDFIKDNLQITESEADAIQEEARVLTSEEAEAEGVDVEGATELEVVPDEEVAEEATVPSDEVTPEAPADEVAE